MTVKKNNLSFKPKKIVSKSAKKVSKKRQSKSTHENRKRQKPNPASLASRLIGTNQQMVRAVLPSNILDPGVAKSNFHSIVIWLKNCEKLGMITDQRLDIFYEKIEKIQNLIMEGNNTEVTVVKFYTKLATVTVYGERGLMKMMNILDEMLMKFMN